ncbi:hypothetical protein F5887DRAFT_1085311 [Amanita rubescens]|nr:hypothetical protein F5887DRAFT_1085311 [Amanita rubescens]
MSSSLNNISLQQLLNSIEMYNTTSSNTIVGNGTQQLTQFNMPNTQVDNVHAMNRLAPEPSTDVSTNSAYNSQFQALFAHLLLQNQSLMAQIPHNNINVSKVKLEENLVSNGRTTPQVRTASAANNSAADILNNRRIFFASLLPRAAEADYHYEELDRDEFDQVEFWDQESFNKWFRDDGKAGGPTARGELSKKLYFLENEDGERIGKNEINLMRNSLKRVFSAIKEHMPDMAKKWLQMSTEFHDMVYLELRLQFPDYLCLCENNWKAREFAKNCIRNWSRNRSKKGKTGSDDEGESDSGTREDHRGRATGSVAASSSKRRLDEENLDESAFAAKKAKTTKAIAVKDPFGTVKIKPVARFKSSNVTPPKPSPPSSATAAPFSTIPEDPVLANSPTAGSSNAPSPATVPSMTAPDSAGATPSSTATPSTIGTTPGPTTAASTTTPDFAGTPPSSTATTSTTTLGPATGPSSITLNAPSSPAMETSSNGDATTEKAPSKSFNDSQKKSASDFDVAIPEDTRTMEVAKKGSRGRAKATPAEGGGQTSGRRARANPNATTAQGLCKNDFLKSRKGATVNEWEVYWKGLNKSERKIWEERSTEVINARKSGGGGGEAGAV